MKSKEELLKSLEMLDRIFYVDLADILNQKEQQIAEEQFDNVYNLLEEKILSL